MGTHYKGTEEERLALGTWIRLSRCANTIGAGLFHLSPLPGRLTPTQFGVLEALHFRGPMHQCDLARKVLTSPGNITYVLDKLEKRDLVRRTTDPADRRNTIAEVRPAGAAIIDDYFPRHAAALADLFAALSPEERDSLGTLCKKLGLGAETKIHDHTAKQREEDQ